ncbi:MAG: hypothetical protein ACKVX7_07970 [Planctomycetota bacterium]
MAPITTNAQELETRRYDVQRLVATEKSFNSLAAPRVARSGVITVEALRALVAQRAVDADSTVVAEDYVTYEDGWLVCSSPPFDFKKVEITLAELLRVASREFQVECVFVPDALARHPAVDDPRDANVRELLANPQVAWLLGCAPRDQLLVLTREREVSFLADYESAQTSTLPTMSPVIATETLGFRVELSVFPLADETTAVVDIACRHSLMTTTSAPVGDGYGAVDLPTIDEAVLSTRVRVPLGKYERIGRVGGGAGGALLLRVDPARAPDAGAWFKVFDISPLTHPNERSQPRQCPDSDSVDEWGRFADLDADKSEFGGVRDPGALESLQVTALLQELGISKLNSADWSLAFAKLSLFTNQALLDALAKVCDVRLPRFRLDVLELTLPRAALASLFDTSTAPSTLVDGWRDLLAQQQVHATIAENSIGGAGDQPLTLSSVRKEAYVATTACLSGASSDGGRVVEACDPVVSEVFAGIDLTASVLTDASRPDLVALRLTGVVCGAGPQRSRTIHFPSHENVITDGVVRRTRVRKSCHISLPNVSVSRLDFNQTIPRDKFVVIDTAAAGETARVIVVRIW